MGKPYVQELAKLADTYRWASDAPLGTLPQAVRTVSALPLLAIGSGGSYTTAHFAAALHRLYSSGVATVMTPLEAVSTPQSLRHSAIFMLTAGGRNPDVLGAFERLVMREPRRFMVLCARTNSPLASRAAKHAHIDFTDFELPSGKDGFLATNSLLASVVLLARAYAVSFNVTQPLPETFAKLLSDSHTTTEELDRRCQPLWEKQTLVVLYGPACHAAAIDLESKFSEAALGNVQLADFRNFAHGRHHWLAKRGKETAVLAIVSPEDGRLADSLLALLPGDIPVVRLSAAGDGMTAGLNALVQVFMVAQSAGKARGIDPGNPKVPPFGRKIYHFRAFASAEESTNQLSPAEAAAIERKSGATITTLLVRQSLDSWRKAYRVFRKRLVAARFRGVVLDYDGTLCSEAQRFEPLPAEIGRQLNRLLRAGATIGVATGRGKSVKKALRESIQSRFWKRVIVGYYNGGDLAPLSDTTRPNGADSVCSALVPIAEVIRTAFTADSVVNITCRGPQITVEPGPEADKEAIWSLLQKAIQITKNPGVSAVRSSHSMDVIAPGVSKLAVVDRVREFSGGKPDAPILCIGDRGAWPGNDFSLLGGPYSLSVDEVSPDRDSCWNIASPGRRGAVATLEYLERLVAADSGLRLAID